VADDLVLSLGEARRLAVRSQHLAGPPPAAGIDGMREVLRGLRVLQLDPVNVVARSHLLVLWSRLGGFDRDDLDTLLWRERWLFEYWAHAASIVLTEDYPIHRVMMRYVMPVLAGERLIGRVVPRMDRKRGELVVEGVFAEDACAGSMAAAPVGAAIESLASFAGAGSVRYAGPVASGVS
jgi:uncharacterized protein YcaQ